MIAATVQINAILHNVLLCIFIVPPVLIKQTPAPLWRGRKLGQSVEHGRAGNPDEAAKRMIKLQYQKNSASYRKRT
jgi:hypothetical protein